MDSYMFLNMAESVDVIKKWCEYYGYGFRKEPGFYKERGDTDNYIYIDDKRSYRLSEEFDFEELIDSTEDDSYPPYKINVDYNIYMDITGKQSLRETMDGINLFFSLAAFVCKTTRSDMLVWFEDGRTLIHRNNDTVFIAEHIVYDPGYSHEFIEALDFFKDIKYTVIDIDKHFGAW